MQSIDLTGKVFGNLVAVEYFIRNGQRRWRCKCSCGGEIDYTTSQLNAGRAVNCKNPWHQFGVNCGQRFGKLVVEEICVKSSVKGKTRRLLLCKCDCGRMITVYPRNLKRGKTHCGCAKVPSPKLGKAPGVAGFNKVADSYRRNAKKKGREFLLTDDECKEMFSSNCHYCGSPPTKLAKTSKKDFTYNGIDRKNSSIGYVKDNCVPCCEGCNYLKVSISYDDFILKVKMIYENLRLGG